MTKRYPKSRLPGPAVRLFDMELAGLADDATVRQGAHEAETLTSRPEVEWVLTELYPGRRESLRAGLHSAAGPATPLIPRSYLTWVPA